MKRLLSALVLPVLFVLQPVVTFANDTQSQHENSLQANGKKGKHQIQEPRDEAHEDRLDEQREKMRERHIDEHEIENEAKPSKK
jgi:hypothetical protein